MNCTSSKVMLPWAGSYPSLVTFTGIVDLLGGIGILARIKSDPALRRIPVVVLTTTDDQHEIQRCYDLGCNVYVTKPVDYETFAFSDGRDTWATTRPNWIAFLGELADRLVGAGVDKDHRGREKASDHAPRWGTLRYAAYPR